MIFFCIACSNDLFLGSHTVFPSVFTSLPELQFVRWSERDAERTTQHAQSMGPGRRGRGRERRRCDEQQRSTCAFSVFILGNFWVWAASFSVLLSAPIPSLIRCCQPAKPGRGSFQNIPLIKKPMPPMPPHFYKPAEHLRLNSGGGGVH